ATKSPSHLLPTPTTHSEVVNERAAPRLFRITLLANERTVAGGTATTTWRFFDGQTWLPLKEHPRATFTRLDCGPGQLWQTQALVLLGANSWLMRVDRTPDRRAPPTDPLDYLRREVRLRKYAVKHTFFKVSAAGSLQRT